MYEWPNYHRVKCCTLGQEYKLTQILNLKTVMLKFRRQENLKKSKKILQKSSPIVDQEDTI